jgi:uncharacterized protein YndB with AHSA1/START domain
MPNIKHMLTIQAPAEKVYRAVTPREGVAGWWTDENTTSLFANCNFRWGFYMQSLKDCCGHGRGAPFRKP